MTNRIESKRFTLFGDLEGMSVAELREFLTQFPNEARIDARSEIEKGFNGEYDSEYFVFSWEE